MSGGNVRLQWDGLRYEFFLKSKEDCSERLILYSLLWSTDEKPRNCFSKGSEEYFLFQKIVAKTPLGKILEDVQKSNLIETERKKDIIKIVNERAKESDRKIHTNFDKEMNMVYSTSSSGHADDITNLINRINILIINKNFVGAENLIKELFNLKTEKLIFQMNSYYFRNQKYEQIFTFSKKIKKIADEHYSSESNKMTKKYFNLFLDNFGILNDVKIETRNLNKFLVEALGCSPEAKFNMVLLRTCLISKIQGGGSDLILYKLRQLGDDSLDNLWRL